MYNQTENVKPYALIKQNGDVEQYKARSDALRNRENLSEAVYQRDGNGWRMFTSSGLGGKIPRLPDRANSHPLSN